jgi:hypothetical protein
MKNALLLPLLALSLLTGLSAWTAESSTPAKPPTDGEGGPRLLTFKELATSTRDADEKHLFPEELRTADGKVNRLRGFMVPYDSLEDMSVFMLMQVSNGCFFCDPPSLNQVVIVHQKAGSPKKFIEDPIEISGMFHLWSENSKITDHEAGFVYVVQDATVTKVNIPNEAFAPAKPDAHRPPVQK